MRVPPHSLDHELALLAACMLEPTAFPVARGMVDAPDFYGAAHGTIWDTYRVLHGRGEPIDGLTVRAELVRVGKLEAVGGDERLLSIPDRAVDPEAVELYARVIRDHARHRALIAQLHELVSLGYAPETTFADFRGSVDRAVRALSAHDSDGDPTHIGEILAQVIRDTQEAARPDGRTGLPTGVSDLTHHLGGWKPGKLYVIAGRPGMGKSALVTSTVLAASDDDPVIVFSLEMPETENGQRILAAECDLDLRDLTDARLSSQDWGRIARACESIHRRPIYVHDKTRTLDQITSKSRRFRIQHGRVAAIVVDYLQLVHGDRRLPREQQISEVTRELKALAKELDCAVIALSQLNRECEQRPDKRPRLSDLRESGAIEQDADAVILVYRRGYYAAQAAKDAKSSSFGKSKRWGNDEPGIEAGEDDGLAELIIAKMRGGPQGSIRCRFVARSARFVDAQEHEKAMYPGGFGDE